MVRRSCGSASSSSGTDTTPRSTSQIQRTGTVRRDSSRGERSGTPSVVWTTQAMSAWTSARGRRAISALFQRDQIGELCRRTSRRSPWAGLGMRRVMRSGWWRRLSYGLAMPDTDDGVPNHASTSLCHPTDVRALSLKEYALIQEFPDDWEFCGTPVQQYEQVGNAVPVRLEAGWLARSFRRRWMSCERRIGTNAQGTCRIAGSCTSSRMSAPADGSRTGRRGSGGMVEPTTPSTTRHL